MNKSPEQKVVESVRNTRGSGLNEQSSISRIHQHILEHDTAILTASRDEFSRNENQERNRELRAYLLDKDYGITEVDGTYIEEFNTEAAEEVKEDSFFVVNLNDRSGFFIDLFKLGEYYNQDSILCIPQGGEGAYLHGTNRTGYPGYKVKKSQGSFHPLGGSKFGSAYKSKPFKFETIRTVAGNGMGRMAVASCCREVRKYTENHGMFIRLSSAEDTDAAWPWPKQKKDKPSRIPVGGIEEGIRYTKKFREERKLTRENYGIADVWEDGKVVGHISFDGDFIVSEC